MDIEDARQLTPAEQHERRRQVIRAYKRGVNKRQIARDVGLSYTGTCRVIDRYEAGGMKALAPRKRDRRAGTQRALSAEQEAHIQAVICDKCPEQLKMAFALWSRIAVRQLILDEYGIDVPVRTVGKYLGRRGFTPQKPIQRAYERPPPRSSNGWTRNTPRSKPAPRWRKPRFTGGDETALVNTDTRGRSYAQRRQTLVAKVVGSTRQKLSMISTVNNQGKARWQIIDGNFNHERLIEFFESLIVDTDRKVFLLLDNLGVHHCKPVKAWPADHADEIEVFHLPSYSPEWGPDEWLNADLKQAMSTKVPARTKPKL